MSDVRDCKGMYSIGEVAKMCNVSRKTLRFYEKLGLIIPDYVSEKNGYRYYKEETMNLIPIIKYYKQMGFKLQEMGNVQKTLDSFYKEPKFLTKQSELKEEEQRIKNSYLAITEWVELLREGSIAIENNIQNVNIKYFDSFDYVYLEQEFHQNYMDAVINIPWVNYLETIDCQISGPVILYYENGQEKMSNDASKVKVLQKPVNNLLSGVPTMSFGGKLFLSSYHIGDLSQINKQYTKMLDWAKENNYEYSNELYERFVIDYWSTMNTDTFVVELLVPVTKKK